MTKRADYFRYPVCCTDEVHEMCCIIGLRAIPAIEKEIETATQKLKEAEQFLAEDHDFGRIIIWQNAKDKLDELYDQRRIFVEMQWQLRKFIHGCS